MGLNVVKSKQLQGVSKYYYKNFHLIMMSPQTPNKYRTEYAV